MRKILAIFLWTGAGLLARGQGEMRPLFDPLVYVDPFIGTAKSDVFTRWGNEGGTYPGAVAPWGLMQMTPETRAGGGYDHGDSTIYFFSCRHHLSGYPGGSAGQIKIMPLGPAGGMMKRPGPAGVAGDRTGSKGMEALVGRSFRHQDEKASPGYYRVLFPDDHSSVEVTASGRVGLFRCTFPAHVIPEIFVGGMGKITINKDGWLQGDAFPAVLRYEGDIREGEPVKDGMILRFASSVAGATVIVLRISVSSAGAGSAKKNIDKETGGLGFDQIKERTADQWRKELSVV
ncbi:MAG TPA: hypothetical protein VL832_10225, partial [Puia sp.]|nr:hypothetical protein [Puia sp.]